MTTILHIMIKDLFQVATLVALFTSQIRKWLKLLFSIIINRADKKYKNSLVQENYLGLKKCQITRVTCM